ncbi:glycoside hydrolase family 5 protein [Enterobacteriaceae bacterium H20N1]|uniref:Glycoside hydrolase family 5 protein n=1 Tax=Dryocola boscaweniae TaxID=2925397 RepID=A0A9X2W7F9_9ENTR|nr:cellulase family glycosylhydrolase [Dryocola boscaweniae]MCT4700649.1 glycoside hydrolase family 5 protein [Dryocola boscaweniae]MCT4717747.1 glycoside hydrolase family 5 protein [Dryocola boscaweniae]
MLKPFFVVAALCLSASVLASTPPALTPQTYTSRLGVGMLVDWAITERGIREFDPLAVRDFQQRGIGHIRIRVAGEPTHQRLVHLQKIVEACKRYNVVPIISYQAANGAENEGKVLGWWTTVARYFAQSDPLLGFDILYEPSEKLTHAQLNNLYEKTAKAIHKISPQRMIFIAPHAHTQPDSLKWPEQNHPPVLVDWHLFPYGPVAVNGKRGWTTGTPAEKAAIRARINNVVRWQQKSGHSSWVGAWSVGDGIKNVSGKQQIAFATFIACELQKNHLPYAVNNDSKFYDGEEGAWRPEMQPLLDAIIKPQCGN